MKKWIIHILLFVFVFSACERPSSIVESDALPPIYPDYTNIVIPVNIAPLNFLLRDSVESTEIVIEGKNNSFTMYEDEIVQFSEKKWKRLVTSESGNKITIRITAKSNGKWIRYAPFYWKIVPDKLDPYLSYRLIEPGYEVWNKIQLCERRIETFDECVLADNNLTDGSCMNCHIYGNQDASLSMFHLRGKNGGTILNRDGKLRKINTKAEGQISPAIYGNFHPSGKYAVFSTNTIIPEFHSLKNERLEVYDTESDIIIIDLESNKVFSSPLLSGKANLETFPVFSTDGAKLYFCTAPAVPLPDSVRSLKYNLCSIDFHASNGSFGTQIDTLFNGIEQNKSVCHPKTSPDGHFLLYTVADYGTFPIWHQETDLQMIDLRTGNIDSLTIVNSDRSDSYHSWSSNSRWFVFASKRDDGLYGKPYFCYVDKNGEVHKPFVLPQRNPTKYDNFLKSFNIPELSKGPVPFNAVDIEKIRKEQIAETVSNR
ncbi:DUF3716 domain-containing protein [Massilibacteroides sp.]|uniref:TolB family protein n=1 Tax=Massilibacteroides sp. TaxID=2034766 RepID=UPI00263A1E96|nr:DUF3716 domain-containing protein [Massilibacteroides sp.]MDD4514125.1 DUF3716 domain-containing protein [Massilibacteroides sp.]